MTAFVAIAGAMVTIALACLVLPLLRRRAGTSGELGAVSEMMRGQLAELAADVERGLLEPRRYAESRRELERRASLEAVSVAQGNAAASTASPRLAAALAAGLPLAAVLLYFAVGTPSLLRVAPQSPDAHPVSAEAMLSRLQSRLQERPADAEGWAMLGRTQAALGRHEEAIAALRRAISLAPAQADWLADLADALAMKQGGRLDGEPLALVQRALAINPDHAGALALAGADAYARKDYSLALVYWERLLAALPEGSSLASSIAAGVRSARIATAEPDKMAAAGSDGVSGRVTLAPGLSVSPGDTLYVFARASEGSAMPLAVLKRRAGDLPLDFKLDDSLAMRSGARLSQHANFVIGVRVSRSGSPQPVSGDLEGWSGPVRSGQTGLRITIDRVVP